MTNLQREDYYRMIRHATFKWIAGFIKREGQFPTTKHWNRERYRPWTQCLDLDAEIKHYCYQRGLANDRFTARGWTLQARECHKAPHRSCWKISPLLE